MEKYVISMAIGGKYLNKILFTKKFSNFVKNIVQAKNERLQNLFEWAIE